MPQETYTLTLSMHSLQTIAAVSTILFLTLITRAVLGSISTRSPDLWPEPLRKTWVKWTVSIIGALFVVALIAAFAVVYDTIHNVFFSPTSGSSSPNLGAGALIAALLGAPFVIWGTYIKYQSLGFQREGHITDRISKAVEQLGAEKTVKRQLVNDEGEYLYHRNDDGTDDISRPVFGEISEPNIEVRIGGLLSLQRIAQDSVTYDKGRDHVRMMQILCAYVRNNAPAKDTSPSAATLGSTQPRLDIQTALDVLRERSKEQTQMEADNRYRLDLRRCNFDGGDLSNIDLSGAILFASRFEGANLSRANLTGARLNGCLINYANFYDATVVGTRLIGAICNDGVNIRDLNIARKPLSVFVDGADMTSLDFREGEEFAYFGSKDTQVREYYAEHKESGCAASQTAAENERLRKSNLPERPKVVATLSPEAAVFANWSPLDAKDFGTFDFRQKFIEKHNLKGWPHDDTPPLDLVSRPST